MRIAAIALLGLGAAALCRAATPAEGRWEGTIHIPGRDQPAVVDLLSPLPGTWAGSLTLPGLRVKGAALADITVDPAGVTFSVASALGASPESPVRFVGKLAGDALAGTFTQAGNQAPFELHRTGAAQLDPPRRSNALAKELEGTWVGSYELGGYPRQVTIKFANHANNEATAEWTIVGKQTSRVPVDLVRQDDHFVQIEASQVGVRYEGRWRQDAGEIAGTFEQGPFELPLVLRRGG